jgi:hypothetical protein
VLVSWVTVAERRSGVMRKELEEFMFPLRRKKHDYILKINVKRCMRMVVKLRKKYRYKVISDSHI